MRLEYQSHPTERIREKGWGWVLLLKLLSLYFLVCMATLPLIDKVWVAKIPLMALPQLPKLQLANSIRAHVLVPAVFATGNAPGPPGSYSPTWAMTRPHGLAAAYLVVLCPVFVLVWWRARKVRGRRLWTYILLILAVADFISILRFARTPGLTIY
jgi:hypothetical protein